MAKNLAPSSRKWRKKNQIGENGGETKINPSANPENFSKKSADNKKKHEKLPSRQRVNMVNIYEMTLSVKLCLSGSDITPCIKIDAPLVVYRFW